MRLASLVSVCHVGVSKKVQKCCISFSVTIDEEDSKLNEFFMDLVNLINPTK